MFRFMTKSADGIVGPRTSFQEEVRSLARKSQHRHLSEVRGGVRLNGVVLVKAKEELGVGCLRRSCGRLEGSVAGL